MQGPKIKNSFFDMIFGAKQLEPTKVVEEPQILEEKPKNKKLRTNEVAVSRFAKDEEKVRCPVFIVLRIRPF